jgi:hypothetical protein
MWVCRSLSYNSFTGTLPTELGTMDALAILCVRRPHPPRPDVCAVIGSVGCWSQSSNSGDDGRWQSADGGASCSETRCLAVVIFEAQERVGTRCA